MRIDGWEERLLDVIERHAMMPFGYDDSKGESNCFHFGMDGHAALTGADPYADERRRYKTEAGAARRLRARGFTTVEDAVAAVCPGVPVSMAQRGDLGIAMVDGAPAVVVFIDAGIIGKGREGMTRLPRSAVSSAYRVR